MESNIKLIGMLNSYISKLETNTLETERYLLLLDFFAKDELVDSTTRVSSDDLMKHLVMGWFVYENLLKI